MQLFYRFIFLSSICCILDANNAFSQTIKNLDSLKIALKKEKTDINFFNQLFTRIKGFAK